MLKFNNFTQTNTTLRRASTISYSSEANPTAATLKSWDEIPGPTSLPFVGQLHHFLPGGCLYKREGINLQRYLFETYGPIVKLKGYFGGPDNVLLSDPESAAEVLRSENSLPKRPGFGSLQYYRKVYKKQKGIDDKYTGLFTDHGNDWKELRSVINPVMLKPKAIKSYAAPLQEIAQEIVQRLKSLRNDNNMIEINFNEEVCLWALESTGLIALGTRLNSFSQNLPKDSPEWKLIENVHKFFKVTDKLDFKPSIWRYYPTSTFKEAMMVYEIVENLSAQFISKAMENHENKNYSNEDKSILEKLLDIDEKLAVTIASDLIFAGVDTVANTLITTFYLLGTNPEKQDILRKEIKAKTERKPYLRACIKEAMRILPVGFGNLRETSKEYNLLGYKIPKHVFVFFCHQYMSIMECNYPKPQEYIPERWLVDKADPLYYGNAHPFAFSVFGYSARSCVGRRVAEIELEIFIANIIENFQIEWVGEPLKIQQSVVNYCLGPFNFVFKDVDI